MTRLVLRGLGARKLRSALTAVAILLGVAMVSGTFVLTDQIRDAFDRIFAQANAGIDVVVTERPSFTSQQGQPAGPIPESVLSSVRDVDGVAAAEGQIIATGALVVDGEYLGSEGGAPALVVSTLQAEPFETAADLVAGRTARASGEVVVESAQAASEDLRVGQRVGLATDVGVRSVEIVGIFDFPAATGGASIVAIPLQDAQAWFDREGQLSLIAVAAQPGVSPDALAGRVEAVLPAGVRAQTGAENAQEQADTISDAIGAFLTPVLLALGGVALLVGAFIIFNTFAITVAQRTRELAITRTVGADRRQVMAAVLGEALVVGVLASVVGLFGGFGFAGLVAGLFDAVGFGLPTASPALAPRTVVLALGVGIAITLLAALIPALRATRVPPVAAMREGATLPRSRLSRVAPYLGAIVAALGVAILVLGLVGGGGASERLFALVGGALLILAGAAPLVRTIVRPLARAAGWPLEKAFGGPARLARDNAGRNPARTAATAGALVIGVALVVLVTVLARGFQESFTGAIEQQVRGDLIVTGEGFALLPESAADALRAPPAIEAVASVASAQVLVEGGGMATINAVQPEVAARLFDFDWKGEGGDALLQRLGPDTAVVEADFARANDLERGDTLTLTGIGGASATFTVTGVYRDPQLFLGVTVAQPAYERLVPEADPFLLVAQAAPGVSPPEARGVAEAALERYPVAEVQTRGQFIAAIEDRVSQILALLYVLLGFSVVISLFGIVNTLVLSVLERTREIGMLRAIGTTRRQLRAIVRYESAITAAIGAVLGVAVGLLFGWLMTLALRDEGIEFVFPLSALLVTLVVAVIAGTLAGVLPARRAARLDVLRALSYE